MIQTKNNPIFEKMVIHRRSIHKNPELMYKEEQTSSYIRNELQSCSISYEYPIAKTGLVALIDSHKPGKTLLVRADMDALPIFEKNDTEYKSTNDGIMHACGHDGHVAVLLELAKSFSQNLDKGRILFVFQPAEEGGNGADKMIEEGILEKYNVDACLALHVWNHIPVGKIGVVNGTQMASVDEFYIKIVGKSGHAAMPQYTVDPILVSANIITSAQSLVSRKIDPLDSCVVTFGAIHSGEAFNAIPEIAEMRGTIRTYSKQVFDFIPNEFTKLVQGIATSMGASATIDYKRVNLPTINDGKMADIVRKASRKVLGADSVTEENARTMGGEDFSAFLNRVPGCYFFVGSYNQEKGFVHPHHNDRFDFDEDALWLGYQVMKEAIEIYLNE
jgi:amidohydrolase